MLGYTKGHYVTRAQKAQVKIKYRNMLKHYRVPGCQKGTLIRAYSLMDYLFGFTFGKRGHKDGSSNLLERYAFHMFYIYFA